MNLNHKLKSNVNTSIELIIFLGVIAWEFLVHIMNHIGLAWWAKIETHEPQSIYWFGPFLSRNKLESNLKVFLSDLSNESPKLIKQSTIKCSKNEPYTL